MTIAEPAREVPLLAEVDVCVVGGGPGGFPAAIAAARAGARVLLVERYGFLGGMATAGLVGPILGHRVDPDGAPAVGGIARECCERMSSIGESQTWEEGLRCWGIGFNAAGFEITADRLVLEAGCELLLHTFCVGAVVSEGRLTHILVESKGGRGAIAAKVFVDATGDADIAFRAGAACTKGRAYDGRPMAMGSTYHLGGLEETTAEQRAGFSERLARAVRDEGLLLYGPHLGNRGSTLAPGFHSINHTRAPGDPTDPRDLTRAELSTRAVAWRVLELLRAEPGGERLHLARTPAHVGVRESRQIVSEHTLTAAHLLEGRKQPDGIARASYWIDIHCPLGNVEGGTVHYCRPDCPSTECGMLREAPEQVPPRLFPPPNDWFDIPWRSLVPAELEGLVVSGRCIGADHHAMSATRVMATCMAIGEAAGLGAAMSADAGVPPRRIDTDDLRARLTATGGLV